MEEKSIQPMTVMDYMNQVNPGMNFKLEDIITLKTDVERVTTEIGRISAVACDWEQDLLDATRKTLEAKYWKPKLRKAFKLDVDSRGWATTPDTDYFSADKVRHHMKPRYKSMPVAIADTILDKFYNGDTSGVICISGPLGNGSGPFYREVGITVAFKIRHTLGTAMSYNIVDANRSYELIFTAPDAIRDFYTTWLPAIYKSTGVAGYVAGSKEATNVKLLETAIGRTGNPAFFGYESTEVEPASQFTIQNIIFPRKTKTCPIDFAIFIHRKYGYVVDITGIPEDSKFPNPKKMYGYACPYHIKSFYGTGEERRMLFENLVEAFMKNGNVIIPEEAYKPRGIVRQPKPAEDNSDEGKDHVRPSKKIIVS